MLLHNFFFFLFLHQLRITYFGFKRIGPKMAPPMHMGRPVCNPSTHLTATSPAVATIKSNYILSARAIDRLLVISITLEMYNYNRRRRKRESLIGSYFEIHARRMSNLCSTKSMFRITNKPRIYKNISSKLQCISSEFDSIIIVEAWNKVT